jgi:gas vesicle protein
MLGLGIFLGFGAALLVAPKPGRELRKEIRSRANRAAERIGSEAPIGSMPSAAARQS